MCRPVFYHTCSKHQRCWSAAGMCRPVFYHTCSKHQRCWSAAGMCRPVFYHTCSKHQRCWSAAGMCRPVLYHTCSKHQRCWSAAGMCRLLCSMWFEPRHEKTGFLLTWKQRQISFAVTAKYRKADQGLGFPVFPTWIVQSLYFLNPKFPVSSHLLWLHSPFFVGPGRKPRRSVFSQRGSFNTHKSGGWVIPMCHMMSEYEIWAVAWQKLSSGFQLGPTQTGLYSHRR